MDLKSKFKDIRFPFSATKDAIGVDIGNSSIKIVQLKNAGNKWLLHKYDLELISVTPETAGNNLFSVEKKEAAVNAIKKIIALHKITTKHAVTSVSGNSVIVRYVEFPKQTYQQLSKTITVEAESYIPFAVQDVNIGFQILGDVMEDGKQMMKTLLVATKKEIIQNRIDILVESGLIPVVIDVDSFAIENAISINLSEEELKKTILVVNSGLLTTNISVIENGKSCVVRDVFIAGDAFTKALQRIMSINLKQAEEYKINYGMELLTPPAEEIAQSSTEKIKFQTSDALMTSLKELISEIQRSIDYYQTHDRNEKRIEKIYLSGGGMMIKNLDAYMQSQLHLPVELFNPFKKISSEASMLSDQNVTFSRYAVAVGLATRYRRDSEI